MRRRRVSDGKMLHLIRMWLKAPVEETDDRGHRRMSGGKKATRGTPQGGVAIDPQRHRGHNKAAVGVANKLARIVWSVWKSGRPFESRPQAIA